ncbi:hypothetical protein I3843_05G095700 [Carya illinoinensis]|uniref:Exocyst subunit Exo70 family protein n=1 Tax=Carya illinoinensis TaxID=32201 RepID=A0A8T1QI68_CARIL|nr:exocyst complex component EXO70B1 [Carya illinoinensis]KAG2706519.1 hypothetical protein I3760_05G107000 [Carya illinoinensis]KAG6653852.1 hypothetical protein CIPAW_05G105300 [Carya illinoinensis]KAG6712424.1 hypothetical protein I3842_05G102800 [Carya illinoinensis]KAG7978719.1 hypothetical protein I3843_05G095700 [Carya illinoinensis]
MSGSFSKDGNKNDDDPETLEAKSDGQQQHAENEQAETHVEVPPPSDPEPSLEQILNEVDRFLEAITINAREDKLKPPEQAPDCVELLSNTVENMVDAYNVGKTNFGGDQDDSFLKAVSRISKLSKRFNELPSSSTLSSSLNRTSAALHRVMSFLEDKFRILLHEESQAINNQENDRCLLHEPEPDKDEEEVAEFSPETISDINKIASAMILAGYENECSMVYGISRRTAFKAALNKLGYEYISIDDVQRMQWESLEGEITSWINTVKQCSKKLFSDERKLCDSIFSDDPPLSRILFGDLANPVVIQLLDFAQAVVLTKRSAEKLFKFLDINETLRDLVLAMDSDSYPEELISEASEAKTRLGEAVVSIFCDLENSIKSDQGRTPVPSGAVHPLTRYVMNYLKYACEYKDTLEQVFRQHLKTEKDEKETCDVGESDDVPTSETSPFSLELMKVMDLLDANLDMKSNLYRDHALRYIFLMNNGRYILQKMKGSTEIHELMGDSWRRKRSSLLRQYHKNYQRETWSKVLQCLSHEGLQVSGQGKVSKPVLKERFKNFNTLFEDIHKMQSMWVVSDEQLQSELRVSISAVMIPAYRSFLGRFKQYLDPGRQSEKYIKYQPEDIETLIEELFDGNPTSMARRRT